MIPLKPFKEINSFTFSTLYNRAFGILVALLIGTLSGNPCYADPILDKADALLQNGQAEAATAIYQAYLKQNPSALSAQIALATIAMRRYQYPKAQHILETALSQHPQSAETAATLGRLFQLWANTPSGKGVDNTHDYRALANEHFTQARLLGGNQPLVLTYVAEWELQQNDLVSAERDLHRALQINPTYVPALQGLVHLYIKVRDLPRGRDAAFQALDLDANNSMTYFLTAELLGQANQPVEAVRNAKKSEQLDFGRLPERDYFLATQYEKLGELPQALRYYESLTGYTPKDAQVWIKRGELYERTEQSAKSIDAYQRALALKPELLNDLLTQARESTRTEKITSALAQWRRILAIMPASQTLSQPAAANTEAPTLRDEAWSAIVSLHALSRFLHPDTLPANAQSDLKALEQTLATASNQALRQLDRTKLSLAIQPEAKAEADTTLQALIEKGDAPIAGEAAFLKGDYPQATLHFEEVDGLSAAEYVFWGDRLLLDQELLFSQVFYQRAYELNRDASLKTAMKRIQAKQALATQKVNEGNVLFNSKQYADAINKYKDAIRIYRQNDNAYLRLGDTYEQLRQWVEAKKAYDTAIALSPSLLESQGFSKNYNRLKKKATPKS